MGKRFSDVNRGGELKLALDNLTQYKTNAATRTTKRITGTGTPTRRNQVFVRIMPFSDTKAANETTFPSYRVKVGAHIATNTTITGGKAPFAGAKANNYFDITLTGAVKPPTGFSAARLSTFESSAAGTYAQSKFTKLYYIKTPGTSYHYAIGRPIAGPDTLDEQGAKEALIAALASDLTTVTAPNFRRISFKDEKMGGVS